MYKALGIVDKKALLVSGIYNIVGPVTSKHVSIAPPPPGGTERAKILTLYRRILHIFPHRSCWPSQTIAIRNNRDQPVFDNRSGPHLTEPRWEYRKLVSRRCSHAFPRLDDLFGQLWTSLVDVYVGSHGTRALAKSYTPQ